MAAGNERDRRGFGDNYRRGLHDAASKNVSAYGYSVTITASFGLLTIIEDSPSASEIFAFAGGAVLAACSSRRRRVCREISPIIGEHC